MNIKEEYNTSMQMSYNPISNSNTCRNSPIPDGVSQLK